MRPYFHGFLESLRTAKIPHITMIGAITQNATAAAVAIQSSLPSDAAITGASKNNTRLFVAYVVVLLVGLALTILLFRSSNDLQRAIKSDADARIREVESTSATRIKEIEAGAAKAKQESDEKIAALAADIEKSKAIIAEANARSKDSEAKIASADAASKDAVAKVAAAEARIAEAQKGAAEARLELAKLKTPRMLDSEQQQNMVRELRSLAGTPFMLGVDPEPEAINLMGILASTLTASGWSWKPVEDPQLNTIEPWRAVLWYKSGLTVAFRLKNRDTLTPAAKKLASALENCGLSPVEVGLIPEDNDLSYIPEDAIMLIVGTKR